MPCLGTFEELSNWQRLANYPFIPPHTAAEHMAILLLDKRELYLVEH